MFACLIDDVTNTAQKSLLADGKENVPTELGVVLWRVPVQTYPVTYLLVLLSLHLFKLKSNTTASEASGQKKRYCVLPACLLGRRRLNVQYRCDVINSTEGVPLEASYFNLVLYLDF